MQGSAGSGQFLPRAPAANLTPKAAVGRLLWVKWVTDAYLPACYASGLREARPRAGGNRDAATRLCRPGRRRSRVAGGGGGAAGRARAAGRSAAASRPDLSRLRGSFLRGNSENPVAGRAPDPE